MDWYGFNGELVKTIRVPSKYAAELKNAVKNAYSPTKGYVGCIQYAEICEYPSLNRVAISGRY